MKTVKSIVLLCGLVVWGWMNISSFRNERLTTSARGLDDPGAKIRVLEKASAANFLEPRVLYSLGRAYHDLGLLRLAAGAKTDANLRLSVDYLRRSIRLNPFSAFSHFYLAQSLLDLDTVSSSGGADPLDEYKRAALLSGFNSEIYLVVGKAFLARWKDLTVENRDFSLNLLKQVMDARDPGRARVIFEVWEMNSPDYQIIRQIIPEDPQIERAYADFLGQKSLSLDERLTYLIKAETLEFQNAEKEFALGENELSYSRTQRATEIFWSCVKATRGIRFYQDLTSEKPLDVIAFKKLQKSCWLNLAKCAIEEGKEFKEAKTYLDAYLALEDRVPALSALESYMKEYGLIKEAVTGNLDDPEKTIFVLRLYFQQNRYRDIIQAGRLMEQNFELIPSAKKDAHVKLLLLIGDSYQKLDFLYDAGDFYRRALELSHHGLEILIRLRMNAERLNNEASLGEIKQKIKTAMSPRDIVLGDTPIQNGAVFSRWLLLDGRATTLDLHFKDVSTSPPSLVSVVFNDKVVWEGYLNSEVLSIPMEARVGENGLTLTCLNRTVVLDKLTYR